MIITCKCQKYKFDIPDSEITSETQYVKCGMCDESWYQNFEINNQAQNSKNELLINSSKNLQPKHKNSNKKNKKRVPFLFIVLILIVIILVLLNSNKQEILTNYPQTKNFFESLEIIYEIISVNYIFIKNLITSQISKIF